MMQKAPLYQAYSLIRRERFQRKLDMYKLAFGVMIDRTTAFYLLLLGGYFFISFFIIGDFIDEYDAYFRMAEEFAETRFWLILTVLPLRYLNQSFSKPGVMFSSSEYQLSLLPYSREKIWFINALEKWLKLALIYIFIGLLIIFITPFSPLLVLKYILLFILFDVLMTVPQWKLYQKRMFVKIGWVLLMTIVNFIGIILSFYIDIPIVGILLLVCLLLINLKFKETLFKGIDWNKVTELCDYQLWNMWLISKASEVKITRQKKYSVFQRLGIGQKPFTYQKRKIYNRLWMLYFSKNIGLLVQVIGTLFIMLVVFLFLNDLIFSIGLAIAIYVYTTCLAILFRDRFEADLLRVLPWDLPHYKRSYFKWGIIGGIILLIPVRIFLGSNISVWTPLLLLFYCSSYLYMYHVKIDKTIELLGKSPHKTDLEEAIGWICLIGIVFSWKYPIISLSSIFIILLLFLRKKKN